MRRNDREGLQADLDDLSPRWALEPGGEHMAAGDELALESDLLGVKIDPQARKLLGNDDVAHMQPDPESGSGRRRVKAHDGPRASVGPGEGSQLIALGRMPTAPGHLRARLPAGDGRAEPGRQPAHAAVVIGDRARLRRRRPSGIPRNAGGQRELQQSIAQSGLSPQLRHHRSLRGDIASRVAVGAKPGCVLEDRGGPRAGKAGVRAWQASRKA